MNGVPPPEGATAAAAAAALMALAVLDTVNHCFLPSSSGSPPAVDDEAEESTEGQACWHEDDECPESEVGSVVVNGQEPRGQWNRPSGWRKHLIWTVARGVDEDGRRRRVSRKGSDVVSVHRDVTMAARERDSTDPCCQAR